MAKNKDADQLRGYREADLHLCFRICKNPVFSRRGSYMYICIKQTLRDFFLFFLQSLSGEICKLINDTSFDALAFGKTLTILDNAAENYYRLVSTVPWQRIDLSPQ